MFLDDRDRRRYLVALERTVVRRQWHCLAYCLMTNHVHMLIETPEPNLGYGMQLLHGSYATWFNKRHELAGHVFQGRYGAKRIHDEIHLITTVRYLDANPVEAGLAVSAREWPWCGAGAPTPPSWLATARLKEMIGL